MNPISIRLLAYSLVYFYKYSVTLSPFRATAYAGKYADENSLQKIFLFFLNFNSKLILVYKLDIGIFVKK